MALLQRIQERITRTGDEAPFTKFTEQQKLMNMYDSLKDGYSITVKCNTTFKEVLSELYRVAAPANYTIPLGKMENEIDALATLGPPPEKKSFLRIEYRSKPQPKAQPKVQPIKENHLPEYVTHLVQDSGYKPSTIQPSGKTVLLCYSEFDPAGREIHEVEHWGPPKGETFTLRPDILNLLGLPDTTITCKRIKDDTLSYQLDISGAGYRVGDTVTIPKEGSSKFNDNKYFTGNTEKNKAIMDLCNGSSKNKEEIKKYAIAKLLGDKLQVIGTLEYIISRGGTNDSVCLFTTDKVVAMLCRILGVSCCLQDHDDDEESKPAKEVKMCRVKYYPTRQDPIALYEAQIDREVAMCINHNNEVKKQLNLSILGQQLFVGSTSISMNDNMRIFLRNIIATIDTINEKITKDSVSSKNLTPAISLLQFAQPFITTEDKYAKALQEFKVIANSLKVNMIVSPFKDGIRALQSASRLFQKGIDLVDPIAITEKTFGVHLLNLNGGGDNDYKKTYAKKRSGQSGGHKDLGDVSNVTTRFLDAAKEAIVLLQNGLTPLLPAAEAEAEAEAEADAESIEPPHIKRTDIGDMSESEESETSGSGTQKDGLNQDGMDSFNSGSDAPVDAAARAAAPGSAPSFLSAPGSAAQTQSVGLDSFPATSIGSAAESHMLSPERKTSEMVSPAPPPGPPQTGKKRGRNGSTNQPTNQQNASQKGPARILEGELNKTNQTGGYKLVRNDDIYPTLSGINDNTAAIDFCYDNDEYDILYLLYSFLTYLGETPWTPEVIEFLILQIITKDLTLVELEGLYRRRYKEEVPGEEKEQEQGQGQGQGQGQEQEQEQDQPQEGGKPKRKTRKRKEPKLKGILKTRNKKKYEAKTRRSKRKTRK
jgi:hypothetical protein